LRTERLASAVGRPPLSRLLQNLLLRIRAGRVVLEQSANDRRPLSLELAIDVNPSTSPKFSILFGEHSWRNVYAGEREVRLPGAPTIGGVRAPLSRCLAVRYRLARGTKMNDAFCRPFYAEYVWAFD
jgi:hypothetical protein